MAANTTCWTTDSLVKGRTASWIKTMSGSSHTKTINRKIKHLKVKIMILNQLVKILGDIEKFLVWQKKGMTETGNIHAIQHIHLKIQHLVNHLSSLSLCTERGEGKKIFFSLIGLKTSTILCFVCVYIYIYIYIHTHTLNKLKIADLKSKICWHK